MVSWAVHVSVGNEIQRETIKSKGERGMMSLDMPHIIFTELITDHRLGHSINPLTVSLSLLTMNVHILPL